ncbi:regulatory-associated protein of TOR 1-like [Cucumis melo]|uniref:Regulatory-associated protein of TOR 1-like n=2 Tax=Cucumis melo TaxID=3656 RepID=A0ABM3KDH0_CUCME|nr:regulatory-associated protein of TOR 1-like [Cucumis melo]
MGGWKSDNGTFRPGYLTQLVHIMSEKLPGCQVRATIVTDYRIKTLKWIFQAIAEMRGPTCNGFGWNDDAKCIITEKELFNNWVKVCFCTNPVWLVKTRMQLQSPLHQAQPYSGLYGLPSYWPFIVFWIFSNHWILSLRFCKRSLLRESLDDSLIDKIPGRQTDRKTLLGELNWIFTAVTDTIAWNVLPHDLFQRLFRQDLLVASLFRNFLLAEWIMRSANCSPISHPMLPPTHQHHMWDAWDMAAEICLSQLPALVEDPNLEFQPSPFFTEQLTAFEVWLDHGSENKKPPESTCALFVGIFPYVLKLLQTTTPELRQILVFIWTKILALDKSASQVHGGLLAAGFFDGSVKLYDARIPELLVCTMRPHVQKVEKVVGIGFQPGLDSSKIVSASQAGDIQFLDIRNQRDRYLTIDAHRGSLTALAVHRHAPILASGSAKQLIKVFSLDGDQLGTIRYHQQACFHCWWNQT